MSATSFLWEIAQKEDNNIQVEQRTSDEENYLTDHHYEQERFTDTYSEYFEDDENKLIGSLMTIMRILQISIIYIYYLIYIYHFSYLLSMKSWKARPVRYMHINIELVILCMAQ